MANNENRNVFLAMNVGTTKNKKGEEIPYAFHCECFVTYVGEFRTASEGKPAMMSLSVAVGRNPWLMLGKTVADEQAGNPNIGEDRRFVNLNIYGDDAVRLKDIQKGAKLVFSGRPEKNTYKKKDSGEDVVSLRVIVDSIYQLASRSSEPDELSSEVTSRLNCYESGGRKVEQMLGMISGTVKSVESLRTTKNGRQVISAKMEMLVPALEAEARINRTYSKDESYGDYKILSISVWGQRAAHMDRILVPGTKLVVTGSASTNEGNDNRKYVNVSVRELSVLKWANAAPAAENNAPASEPAPSGDYQVLEDLAESAGVDLPF